MTGISRRRVSVGSLLAVALCVAVVLAVVFYAVDRDGFFEMAARAKSCLK